MNRTWPRRSSLRSAASGSLTFTIISARAKISAGAVDDRRAGRDIFGVGQARADARADFSTST